MHMPYALDFAELKQRVSIEQVASWIGAQLKPHGAQLRGPCPICKAGGDRAFVITPAKRCYYCFGECRKGGDIIALVANAKGLSAKEAAEAIARHFGGERTGTVPHSSPQPMQQEKGALKPLDYLQSDHEAVRALGLSEETAQAFAMGYAPRGILRGRVAVPIRDRAGVLLAYCGIATTNEQSPRFLFPSNFDPASAIFNADRIAAGELNLLANVVQVLEAFQNGVENTVCFLTEGITAQQLEQLASLMDQKKVDSLTL
jgi:DNA primase